MALTYDDFRFSQIAPGMCKPPKLQGQIYVAPYEKKSVYKPLLPTTHHGYIKHNIEQIKNDAPTLDQYWHQLLIYRPELVDSEAKWNEREPTSDFFRSVNINFATSMNVKKRKPASVNHVPVYFYHVNDKTGEVEHLDMLSARKIYCKKYEEILMMPKSTQWKMFTYLVMLCRGRNKDLPIMIRGIDVVNAVDSVTYIPDMYWNPKKPFGFEYCLAEMLINYPNLKNCVWNRDGEEDGEVDEEASEGER